MRSLTLSAALCVALASCGGDSEASSASSPSPTSPNSDGPGLAEAREPASDSIPTSAWDAAKGTAHVTGTVRFDGDPPRRRKVDMGSDAACHATLEEAPRDESVIVGADGALQNVFVYVRSGLEAWEFTPPGAAVTLDQEGCTYKPHVAGIQVGQPLIIRNTDPVTHNVHLFARKNKDFNQTQGKGSDDLEKVFDREEVLLTVKCDMHGWMNAYLGIVEHPFFAVSAADGSFDLGKLPPGTYTIEAKHEVLGRAREEITIGDGESKAIEFTFTE